MRVLGEQHPGLRLFVWTRWTASAAASAGKDAKGGRAWVRPSRAGLAALGGRGTLC